MIKCTKPDCDCLEIAIEKNGGTDVKIYPCLAGSNTPMPTEFKKPRNLKNKFMSKEVKDYLHLYLGCECYMHVDDESKLTLEGVALDGYWINSEFYTWSSKIKPILRPLSDATPKEIKEIEDSRVFVKATPVHMVGSMQWTPETFRIALSKHFDIFNLIPEGLAIDATTLKK